MGDGVIKVGVVGLGCFGRYHARHYAAHAGVELVAVADVDAERAGSAAAQFGGAPFQDYRDLIGRVDAVSVVVPAREHAAVAGALVDAGIHVLVEKPIADTAASARALVARADKRGVVLQVGHVERFSPVIREMRQRATAPRRIASVRRAPWSERCGDVDVVLDLMIHDIDHVLAFAGGPVASVAASGMAVKSGRTDVAEAWLIFAGGTIATLSASRVAERSERTLSVREPGLALVANLAGDSLSIGDGRGQTVQAMTFPPHDNLAAEIGAFVDSVRSGSAPEVGGRAGLAALAVAERVQAAIAETARPARRRARA